MNLLHQNSTQVIRHEINNSNDNLFAEIIDREDNVQMVEVRALEWNEEIKHEYEDVQNFNSYKLNISELIAF